MHEDIYEDALRPGPSYLTPILVSALSLAVGGMAGAELVRAAPDPTPVAVVAAPTDADLDAYCAPRVEASAAALDQATQAVDGLAAQVEAKSQEVASLEQEIARVEKATTDQARRLAAAKAELGALRRQLASAETDKLNLASHVSVLQVDLATTAYDLRQQRVATMVASSSAIESSWAAFAREAQIQICDRGTRATLGRCRETVQTRVAQFEGAYKACLRAGAATPTLREAGASVMSLPQYSQWVGPTDRVTEGWYAVLCDPTLPEAGDRTDGAAMVGE